ncbi:MarR family transcriptional regulator [Paenibacillus sp. JJ-223]|uniref:MarR family winged helix-turn-helix transcriptional regulator n=1 Tax=Paenibacillus sp. JJ-223 TaxID=2905647 RepID=UPI001F356D16|nr:MarR family transcriptional regulator [Paenibacillus sp. JJ-223]CAH1210453.1 hypothetical protein PAECIP111890_03507 [Paenibacillus sp. JJ-223]
MRTTDERLDTWFSLTHIQSEINEQLEQVLQQKYGLSLKEFYVLYFISQTDDKELRLQQLQEKIGLSQSATSRLVARMEAETCGALERHMCEKDRRGIYTGITERGEMKLRGALETFDEVLQEKLLNKGLKTVMESLVAELG